MSTESRWWIQYHPELQRWRVVDVVFPLSPKYRTKRGAEARIRREARRAQRKHERDLRKKQIQDGWVTAS